MLAISNARRSLFLYCCYAGWGISWTRNVAKKIPSILLHAVFEDSYSNIACFHLVLLLVIEFKCAFGDVYTRSPIVQKLIELAKCEHYLTCDSVCLAPKKGYSAADNNSLSEKQ